MSGDKPIEPWRLIESTYTYRDRWLTLRSDRVRLPSGNTLAPYHVIEIADWVNVIALRVCEEIGNVPEFIDFEY